MPVTVPTTITALILLIRPYNETHHQNAGFKATTVATKPDVHRIDSVDLIWNKKPYNRVRQRHVPLVYITPGERNTEHCVRT